MTIAAQHKCSVCGWYGCVPGSRRPGCRQSRTTTYDYRLVTFGPEVRQDLGALLAIIREDQRPLVRCYAESVALLCRMWDNANQREWFA